MRPRGRSRCKSARTIREMRQAPRVKRSWSCPDEGRSRSSKWTQMTGFRTGKWQRTVHDVNMKRGGHRVKILLVALMLLAGCAETWNIGSASEQQFRRDEYECERDAAGLPKTIPAQAG